MSRYGGCEGPFVYPVLRKDKTNIGYVQAVPLDGGIWEIGYHIGAKYTKHGYATEAVSAFLPVIMERIGVTKMAGICLADNIASQNLPCRQHRFAKGNGKMRLYFGIQGY